MQPHLSRFLSRKVANGVTKSACGGCMVLAAAWALAWPVAAHAIDLEAALQLQRSAPAQEQERLGAVREMALRDIGQALGARIGFAERSREILALLDARAADLDRRFDFGRLVIGNNVLPPVISESRDAVAIERQVMRVAGVVYRIDEPARFAVPSPTWRDWLWMGLDPSPVSAPDLSGSLPENAQERAFWQQVVREGHALGRQQAQEVFDLNMALLERTYSGMRRYYDLFARGVVSAPIIATAHALTRQEDENTMAVGDTVFRITAPSGFTRPQQWQPLDAPLQK